MGRTLRMDEFLDSSAQAVVKLEVFSAYVDYTVRCCHTEMDATGLYRKAAPSAPMSIPGVRLAPTIVELNDEKTYLMTTRHGVMPSTASRTFGQTGCSWLRRSTGPSETA